MVGRQLPFLALLVPLVIVYIVDGRRGLRETWPVALLAGSTFAVAQFVTSNYVSFELTDVVASLASLGAIAGYLRLAAAGRGTPAEYHGRRSQALAPYLILIVVLTLAQVDPVKGFLADRTKSFHWPGLEVTTAGGGEPPTATFTLNWLASPGTQLLLSGLLTMLALRIPPRVALAPTAHARPLTRDDSHDHHGARARVRDEPFRRDRDDRAVGRGCRRLFALISPLIGWLGVAITGSVTASNSLFGGLQVAAAHDAGLSPTLVAAGNSTGGVLAKMLSPQHLAIAAAAAGIAGREGDLMRSVLKWSIGLVAIMCVLVYLQSTAVLSWMVP